MDKHLLNLRALPGVRIADFSLLGFEGREEISGSFDYRLELVANADPDLTQWIGHYAEFDVYPGHGQERVFGGRIYSARKVVGSDLTRVFLQIRPAYHALSYARATHFVQDKTSVQIFEAMVADATGLVKDVSVSPAPPVRGYAVRYDESESDFLDRLLAQDGIMYFFVHDPHAGAYRHRMIVTNKPADYIDIAAGPVEFLAGGMAGEVEALERSFAAGSTTHKHASFNVNKLDTPFIAESSSTEAWRGVYSHRDETIGFEAVNEGDLASRQKATNEHVAQAGDIVEGTSTEPSFMAGGRVEIKEAGTMAPARVVLTSVIHSARDPWMFQDAATATYSNRFTAIDANRVYRPATAPPRRQAPGPMLGMIAAKGAEAGEIKVDKEWRVPVEIAHAREYDKFDKYVWLPVQQQWAHSTHGAQFFPRVGTRVIIDFLYGNPDLPFITGTVYTPAQPYPFDPASKATQSGWRSVTEKNGAIVQEFRFEDKKGEEEVYLYTGRDYRREIDNDDWGTIKNNQTLEVQQDRKRTVKGQETVDVTKTRTVTVTDKNLLESMKEVEIKVGPSSIKLTMQGIEITAPKITIKADVKLDMSGGAMAALKAPKTDVNADAMLTLKGGVVMIN